MTRRWAHVLALHPALMILGTACGVWLTVGVIPAVLAALLVALDRLVPSKRVLATVAVVVIGLVPVLWFVGSSAPLTPPAPRIQANTLAHMVGGLGVWLLFVAVLVEREKPLVSSHRQVSARLGGSSMLKKDVDVKEWRNEQT